MYHASSEIQVCVCRKSVRQNATASQEGYFHTKLLVF